MTSTSPSTPAPIKHHWVMTIQTADGRQATNDGQIDVIPGLHTRATSYTAVLNGMKEWVGVTDMTVLFFDLQPNQL
ncbi:hypothetical protein OG301_39175 (plasmid) [Streptomyces platensis]|uniref:hypothetical protein n=1 Tax=Streptomyces platensis TaxID=58346 RepID=UPI002ED5307E|nr:hypothetical protein OG301_39175 [Streptomyces platensis]